MLFVYQWSLVVVASAQAASSFSLGVFRAHLLPCFLCIFLSCFPCCLVCHLYLCVPLKLVCIYLLSFKISCCLISFWEFLITYFDSIHPNPLLNSPWPNPISISLQLHVFFYFLNLTTHLSIAPHEPLHIPYWNVAWFNFVQATITSVRSWGQRFSLVVVVVLYLN